MFDSLSKDDLSRLAKLVKELSGNNVQEKNYPMLESRLRTRMMKLGIVSIEDYWTYYSANEASERHIILGLMTTHYTFFFREYAHFEALESWIISNAKILKSRYDVDKRPVKIWSAACSRGQEVYSLAMFLDSKLTKQYGIPFEILGTDIDSETVKYAKNGVYPIKEVNTIPQHYLQAYWRKGTGAIQDFAAVNPILRDRITFKAMNLLDIGSMSSSEKFDVIFIRNVFIYFSEEDVRKIALELKEHLEHGGMFVSGLSEPLRFQGWDLASPAPSVYLKPNVSGSSASAKATQGAAVGVVGKDLEVVVSHSEKYKVLCVDDSGTIQVLMKKIFSQDPNCAGVISAMNGEEAKQKLASGVFDLITLDIHMPVMDGLQFLETVYDKSKHPPVIVVSSVNRKDMDLATKAMSLGAFDYVEKPAMNSLQKSIDEIHTKTKMALRSKSLVSESEKVSSIEDFNKSIAQKIVVPDASLCLRWIRVHKASLPKLEFVLKAMNAEYRSPALVLSVPQSDLSEAESAIVNWSQRKVARIHDSKALLRPNQIYIMDQSFEADVISQVRAKKISLQILAALDSEISYFGKFENIQVLVDEPLAGRCEFILQRSKLELSDVTPSTSFASLSLEFFANLRKAKSA